MKDNTTHSQLLALAPESAARVPAVLMVEDEILIRMPIAEYLRSCGYRVVEASTGDEAQQLFLSGEAPDVLFSDINMPGTVGGFELAEWVNERFPQVKIILTSGASPLEWQDVEQCRAHGFLHKPYPPKVLEAYIKRLLDMRVVPAQPV